MAPITRLIKAASLIQRPCLQEICPKRVNDKRRAGGRTVGPVDVLWSLKGTETPRRSLHVNILLPPQPVCFSLEITMADPKKLDLLTTRQVAEYTHMSASFFDKRRSHKKKSPAYLKIGACVFYRRAVIDAWLEARSCEEFTHGA